mgnify:CR=1 FL=1
MKIVSLATSLKKGTRKTKVDELRLVEDHGVEGDAHAGDWHRQVSLLAWESIEKMRAKGLNVHAGSFAENITTEGLSLVDLPDDPDLYVHRIGRTARAGRSGRAIAFCAAEEVTELKAIEKVPTNEHKDAEEFIPSS